MLYLTLRLSKFLYLILIMLKRWRFWYSLMRVMIHPIFI